MSRRVLALDLAKEAGFAFYGEGEPKPILGVIDVSNKMVGDRLASLSKWLHRYSREWGVTDIACESPVIGGGKEDKIIWLVGAYAVTMMVGSQCKIDVRKIGNSEFFLWWCGTNAIEGDNRKTQSILEAQRRGLNVTLGNPPKPNHNAADAAGVLSLRCVQLDVKTPWDSKRSPGPLFTNPHAPAGVKITKANKIAANVAVNKLLSFDREKPS